MCVYATRRTSMAAMHVRAGDSAFDRYTSLDFSDLIADSKRMEAAMAADEPEDASDQAAATA